MEIIWGIQLKDLLLFLKQLGLAIVGASALWGFVFSIRDQKQKDKKSWIIDDLLSIKIFNLFIAGLALSFISYLFLMPILEVFAHEGISIAPMLNEITATFPLMSLLYIVLLILSFIMLIFRKKNEEYFSYLLTPFYAIVFIMAFVMTSFSGWRGSFDSTQIFYFMHGFHSIFTLGSVIVLDFLFVISSRSELLKQHVYRLFPTISKVIWVGLSLDFISVFLISNSFVATEKFLFVQTVIAILIINGVLLSGPIARKMTNSLQGAHYKITGHWRRVGNIAGALSITSWITITMMDFFTDITLNYEGLLIMYLSFFVLAFIGHMIFETLEKKRVPLTLSSEEI